MIRNLLSVYSVRYPATLIYMLQSVEYEARPYLVWYWRTTNFGTVMKRRRLHRTKRAKLLLWVLRFGLALQLVIGLAVLLVGAVLGHTSEALLGLLVLLSAHVLWAHIIVVPLVLARLLIVRPAERKLVASAQKKFDATKALKIAVAGSYGKTTMKELLKTVLSEGKNVAATPGNMNVSVSHARFVDKLKGDEDIVIVEYGEGQPGDVERFNKTIRPAWGVITGLAPAHLDKYGTLESAAQDIFSLVDFVGPKNAFVNDESPHVKNYLPKDAHTYNRHEVLDWKVSRVKTSVGGLSFTMKHGKRTLRLKSGLLGEHLVGSIAFCAALAIELGLTDKQVVAGVAKTTPFEHRMQARPLAGGWVIDDTYNGNLEGVRAGLALLKQLKATRKTYVTPGLVDQGIETEAVHQQIGELIAEAAPERVVLMQNSVTPIIRTALEAGGFRGELIVEPDPLRFYTNLEHFIAVGDVVLMQNDWTDNYN